MDAQALIVGFLDGTVPGERLQRALAERDDLERLLAEWDAPPSYVQPSGAFHYLLELDLLTPSGELNARGLLEAFLQHRGVAFDRSASEAATSRFDLLLDAQPRWLDLGDDYLASMLAELADLDGAALASAMRRMIKQRFRSLGNPPRWLQSPAWPIIQGTPAVFIGQLRTAGHDEACVYVFLDEASGEHITLVQVA